MENRNEQNEVEGIKGRRTGYGETDEEERQRRRRERIARMKREKERRLRMQRIFIVAAPSAIFLVVCMIVALAVHVKKVAGKEEESATGEGQTVLTDTKMVLFDPGVDDEVSGDAGDLPLQEGSIPVPEPVVYSARVTSETEEAPEEVISTNAIFLDLSTGDILAQRDCKAIVNPASMTKVLTLLVAAERVTDLDDTFTITIDITDYSYHNDCSSAGFDAGETVTVRDLLYGTILPSGGDAALALAIYVAGSQEAFVELMNEKLEELGLSETAHFTNCIGLYDAEHHCSVYDMAMIMEAAINNELCREVLRAHWYTTSETPQHPEGIKICNLFLRRIEDKDTGGEVLCAKTGFVNQSGSCAVSYGVDRAGREYVCATTGAYSAWRCIYDHVELYRKYATQAEEATP